MSSAIAVLRHLGVGMNALGVVCVLVIVCLISADIIGRNLFASPLTGVPELVALLLVSAVFLQLPLVVLQQKLTRTVLLAERLARGVRGDTGAAAREAMFALLSAAILLLLAAGAWPDFVQAWQDREFVGVEGYFTIRVWPVKGVIVLGALVGALAAWATLQWQACREADWLAPLAGVVLLACVVLMLWTGAFEPRTVGWVMTSAALLLIASGLPIALALLLCGFLGLLVLRQDAGIAIRTLSLAAEGSVSEYLFATVPLFVLMGLLVSVSDIGRAAFASAQRLCGRLPGGLGVATVVANAIFAAITGISIASAAIFSRLALPELVQQGYSKKFAVGLIAGSSVLGMLIPPSLLLIIYGVIAEVSIGALFVAAIVPGLLLALLLALTVVLLALYRPGMVGNVRQDSAGQGNGPAGNESNAAGLTPLALLILVVLGGIYGGFFTPTEAGAAGSCAALAVALWRRRLDWRGFHSVLQETGQVSASILFLITCATTFSMMLTLSELPQAVAAVLGDSGLGMPGFLLLYLLVVLLLGTVLDSTSILLIMLPLALPVVTALGGNLIWFGVVTVLAIEIGLLTPPLGLSVYVIKSSIDDDSISLGTIFAGAFPFVLVTLLATLLLMAFPDLALFLL